MKLKITQIKSAIGYKIKAKRTLEALESCWRYVIRLHPRSAQKNGRGHMLKQKSKFRFQVSFRRGVCKEFARRSCYITTIVREVGE